MQFQLIISNGGEKSTRQNFPHSEMSVLHTYCISRGKLSRGPNFRYKCKKKNSKSKTNYKKLQFLTAAIFFKSISDNEKKTSWVV